MPTLSPRRHRSGCLLVAAAAGLRLATAANADPAPAETVPVASVWVGSEAAVRDAADRVGVPLPPAVGVATLEQMFGFFHPGDIRTDAPLGIIYLSGAELTQQQSIAMALPIAPGAVPLTQLPHAQKTAAADTVTVNGIPFRRTADNLLLMGTVAAVTNLDVTAEQAAMRPAAGGPTPVLAASIDIAAWRKAAPGQFADAVAKIGDQANAGQRAGAMWAQNWMRTDVDRLAVALDQTRDGWTVTGTIVPFPGAHGGFPRPGLPAGCAARADMQLSGVAVGDWVRSLTTQPGGRDDPAETAAGVRMSTTVFLGDAETYAIGMIDDKPAVICITQRAAPTDLAADVAAMAKDAAAMPKNGDLYRGTAYKAADGSPVYRFTVKPEGGGNTGYIDVTARGNLRYTTISSSDAHLVEKLPSLPPETGTIDALGTGWLIPARTVDLLAALVLTPDRAAATADRRKQWGDRFGDGRITWTAKSVGPGATFTVEVPNAILTALGEGFKMAQR